MKGHNDINPDGEIAVSVLVRSRNDGAYVRRTLDALRRQRCPFAFEVVSCDDSSTDGTREELDKFEGLVRVNRPEGPYRPGRTLNRMVAAARGRVVVFNNADAVPLDEDWLANLAGPVLRGEADAAFANQFPRPDADWLVRKDSERAFGDGGISKNWPRFFSLASSAARRDDLLENPFDETLWYNEDTEWANRRAELRRTYVPTARVEHSHNYTMRHLWRRFYGEGFSEGLIFGDGKPGALRTIAGAAMEAIRDAAYLFRHPHGLAELPFAPLRRLIQRWAWRAGMVDAAEGCDPKILSTARDKVSSDGDAEAMRPEAEGHIVFTGVYPHLRGGLEMFAARAKAALEAEGYIVDCYGDVPGALPPAELVVMQKIPKTVAELRRLKYRYGDRLRFYAHDHELYCLRRHYYTPCKKNCARIYGALPCRLCAAVTRPKWIWRALTRDMRTFAAEMSVVRCWTPSNYIADNLVKSGIPSERVEALPPLFVEPVPRAGEFMPAGTDGVRRLRILFMGQLIAGKGVGLLVEASRMLKLPHEIVIVGDGKDGAKLRESARDMPHVKFEGWQNGAERYFAEADVCVVPSLWNEPFATVGAEAMAHGVPVVAFNVGGLSDWLKHGETGLFAESATAEALAEALAQIADPAKLAAMSEAALKLAARDFSPVKFIRRFTGKPACDDR